MDFSSESTTARASRWTARLAVRVQRFKALFRRRWWILLLTVSICLAVQGWRVYVAPDAYESTGKMMVSGRLDNVQGGASYSEDLMNFYGTQIEIMESDDVQERARRRVELENPGIVGKAKLVADQVPRTSTFTLIGTATNPVYAQKYVDAVMDEFMAYKRDKRQETTNVTMVQISEELARLRTELDEREKALDRFIEENNMAFWEEQSKTAARFLSDLKTHQADLMKEDGLLENLSADQLLARGPSLDRSTDPSGSSPADGNTSSFMSDNDLRSQFLQKRQELFEKRAEIEELSTALKPKHPKLIAMKDEAAALERLINVIKGQGKESANARSGAIKAELESVKASIASWESKVLESSKKGTEYKRYESAVTRTRDLYEKLLLSVQNLDISKNINQETIQVMQRATPAEEARPSIPLNLLLGLIAGGVAGIGILIVMDRADDRFTSFHEINEHFSLPVLGQIPEVEDDPKAEDGGSKLLLNEDTRYMYAEAFRNLRSSIVFMPDQGELKTLLVTSSIPGEGKSTIASNLAVTMSHAGARVLLVDADLKRGDLAKMFDVDGRFGFSSVLRDDASWQTVAQKTNYENLTLLARGPIASNPAELLLQPSLEAFLSEVREAYDLVIFNSAPILATDDTTTLAPSIDGVLMVVRAFVTSARLAENSLNGLYQRQARILGLILNSVNTQTSEYYHYRYSQYYSKTA